MIAKAYTFGSHRKAFCIPRQLLPSQPSWHVLFAHVDPCVVTGNLRSHLFGQVGRDSAHEGITSAWL